MSDAKPTIDLTGKVALVTGAASGIGAAAAVRYAEAGAAVMCADLNGDGAKTIAETVNGSGGRAAALQLDVSDESAVEKSLQQTIDALGGFDILFNNAGIGAMDYDRTIDVNLHGVYYGLRYGAAALAESGGGAIVSTTSIAGLQGLVSPFPLGEGFDHGGGVAYVSSKHAVVGMTKQYAITFAERGVRVNAVAPGYIDTPMTDMIRDGSVVQAAYEDLHPMGRLGRPEEIADAAVYLSSDRASFITGVTLPVDGGYSAR
ncbi:MAG: SDR family NAD(P)-dependent oxidoreductase [Myxococcota bacterium]|nr:SDR family NAD(P)-dependent oxidoreductase [Myxococcota bacterium]